MAANDKNTKSADEAETADETAAGSDEAETTEEAADETAEETAAAPTPIASKSKASPKATVERVGSAGSSGASLVFECSLGDFHARGEAGADQVKEHIAAEHGKNR